MLLDVDVLCYIMLHIASHFPFSLMLNLPRRRQDRQASKDKTLKTPNRDKALFFSFKFFFLRIFRILCRLGVRQSKMVYFNRFKSTKSQFTPQNDEVLVGKTQDAARIWLVGSNLISATQLRKKKMSVG